MIVFQYTALSGSGQQQRPFKIFVNLNALSAFGEVTLGVGADSSLPAGALPPGTKAFIDVNGSERFWVTATVEEILADIEELEEQNGKK